MGRDGCIFLALTGVPVHAFADMERVGAAVIRNRPVCCQAWHDQTVAVKFDQAFDDILA